MERSRKAALRLQHNLTIAGKSGEVPADKFAASVRIFA